MSEIDINIIPFKDCIFNEIKSEHKWFETALVKVPSISSNIGVYKQTILHGKTGLLSSNPEDWYNEMKTLILDNFLRQSIAENAFEICKEKYNTLSTGNRLAKYISSVANRHIGFVFPSLIISGGIYVILEHALFLQDSGWDVDLLIPKTNVNFIEFKNHKFNTLSLDNTMINTQYDVLVAILYSTIFIVLNYSKVKRRLSCSGL